MKSEKLDEALQYFKRDKRYAALFRLIRQKYESLGRFGGSIHLEGFSKHEIEALALFMGMSPHHLEQRRKLMIADFEQRLQDTRFAGITLHALLEAYYGERLQSRKTRNEELVAAQMERLAEFKRLYPEIAAWFTYLEGRTSDSHWIWRLLLEPDFAEDVRLIAAAYSALPDETERYPLFSQRATGNPHALDLGTMRGKLWLHLLHVLANGEGPPPAQAEQVNELLLQYRLLRDDIQNFVTLANLLAYSGDGVLHPVWRAAVEEQMVLNVPIRELLKIDKVTAADGGSNVYVVENSGVFSALLDEVPDAPLICTHGQFKLAGLRLMDLLQASGHTLHYSGDFDPEGLSMAVRFVERYGGSGQVWRMSLEDYEQSIPMVELGTRNAKLDAVLESALSDIALAMRERGKMGYQEGIIHLLVGDLQRR